MAHTGKVKNWARKYVPGIMVVAFLTWFYLITMTANKVDNYSHFAGFGSEDGRDMLEWFNEAESRIIRLIESNGYHMAILAT